MKTNRLIEKQGSQNLDLAARVRLEKQLTDAEAAKKVKPVLIPSDWSLEHYANPYPWRRYAFDFIGSVQDKVILDLGCGYQPTPIYFARSGARVVYACDVSPKAIANLQRLARQYGVSDRVRPLVCAAEELPLPNDSIDLVHGEAVLHHLQLGAAGAEIRRILRPGGKAVFKDPLGQNPLLEFARDYLPYAWKADAKGTDRPMKFSEVEQFGSGFSLCRYRGFGLLSMLTTYATGRGNGRANRLAHRLDEALLPRSPLLQRYCRFVVACVQK